MPRRRLLLLLSFALLSLVSSCLFRNTNAPDKFILSSPVEDYMGLEEGAVWKYTFFVEGEEVEDILLMSVVSKEESDGVALFKVREEWGPSLEEEPLHGYYWSHHQQQGAYYEVGRWSHDDEILYDEEERLFILHQEIAKGDKVFENYTHGDSFTVLGKESVRVKAGSFEAWLLESKWGDRESGPWEEDRIYFAPNVGVVKRELVRGYSIDGVVQEEFPYVMELLDYHR